MAEKAFRIDLVAFKVLGFAFVNNSISSAEVVAPFTIHVSYTFSLASF